MTEKLPIEFGLDTFGDIGSDDAGADKVEAMIDESIAIMNQVNPVMANRIEHKKSLINLREIIRSIRHSAKG